MPLEAIIFDVDGTISVLVPPQLGEMLLPDFEEV